jgi:hypothetical protein
MPCNAGVQASQTVRVPGPEAAMPLLPSSALLDHLAEDLQPSRAHQGCWSFPLSLVLLVRIMLVLVR